MRVVFVDGYSKCLFLLCRGGVVVCDVAWLLCCHCWANVGFQRSPAWNVGVSSPPLRWSSQQFDVCDCSVSPAVCLHTVPGCRCQETAFEKTWPCCNCSLCSRIVVANFVAEVAGRCLGVSRPYDDLFDVEPCCGIWPMCLNEQIFSNADSRFNFVEHLSFLQFPQQTTAFCVVL